VTKPIIILSFLLLPVAVFAQRGNAGSLKKKKYRGEEWTLSQQAGFKYTPTSLFDIYGATLPLGFEYYLQEKFGLEFEVSFPLYYVLNNYNENPRKTINSDYKLRFGARQYFRLREKSRMYFGAEIFFRRQSMELRNSFIHFVDESSYDYADLNAKKNLLGAGGLMGYARKLSDHFILEGHIGVGLRLIKMETNFDRSNAIAYDVGPFRTIIPPNEDRVGDRDINIYLPFAIKIGYLF
jgi:hypothetical protein